MTARLLASGLAALLAAATQAAPAYEPTGEILFRARGGIGTGASFDADRIVGPAVNLTRQEGGSWAGDLAGQNVVLEVSDTRVSGANVDIHLGGGGKKRTIRGIFFNQRFSLDYGEKSVSGRVGACSFELPKRRPGVYEGSVGCMDPGATLPRTTHGVMTLVGEASQAAPPLPQFALALVAVLAG